MEGTLARIMVCYNVMRILAGVVSSVSAWTYDVFDDCIGLNDSNPPH